MKRKNPGQSSAGPGWPAKLALVLALAILTGGGVFWALQTCVGPREVVLPEVRRVDVRVPTTSTQPAATRPADSQSVRP